MEENTEAALVFGQEQLNRLHLNDIFNVVAYSVMSLGKLHGVSKISPQCGRRQCVHMYSLGGDDLISYRDKFKLTTSNSVVCHHPQYNLERKRIQDSNQILQNPS